MNNCTVESLFPEVALVLKKKTPLNLSTCPAAVDKTPTTDDRQVYLATAVDGGTGGIALG